MIKNIFHGFLNYKEFNMKQTKIFNQNSSSISEKTNEIFEQIVY